MRWESCPDLKSITIPDGVKLVGSGAFNNCTGLTSVKISRSVTSIGDMAFVGCASLTTINVNKDNPAYISVDDVLLNKTKDTLVLYPGGKHGVYTISNGVTTIGKGAFAACTKLTFVTIPNGITEIGEMAFMGCTGLTSVTIPNGVTKIGGTAFHNCAKLTSVTIPRSVTSIGEWAFVVVLGDPSLTTVTCLNPVPPVIDKGVAFYTEEQSPTATLYVPANAISAYKRAKGWRDFEKILSKMD